MGEEGRISERNRSCVTNCGIRQEICISVNHVTVSTNHISSLHTNIDTRLNIKFQQQLDVQWLISFIIDNLTCAIIFKRQYSQSTILVSNHSLHEPVGMNNQRSLLVSNHSLHEPVGMNNQRSLLVSNHSLQEPVGMNNQKVPTGIKPFITGTSRPE